MATIATRCCRRLQREGYTRPRGGDQRQGGARAPRGAAVRSRAPRHHDAGARRLPGAGAAEGPRHWRHIPVIMISALSEFDSVVRCIELGAEDYLPKPFNSVLLKARVSASLERKRLHDREAAHLAEIDRQRQRADRLLHAILPGPAVAELKADDRIAPRRFEEVAVLFARRPRLYPLLRPTPARAGGRQPRLAGHGVRGDHRRAMASRRSRRSAMPSWRPANLLEPHDDSVMACLLPHRRWPRRRGSHRRTGRCASASISARWSPGVVGSTKFSFDLWGDTVNVAQRLSSYGAEAATYLSAARLGPGGGSRARPDARAGVDQRQGRRRDHPLCAAADLRYSFRVLARPGRRLAAGTNSSVAESNRPCVCCAAS